MADAQNTQEPKIPNVTVQGAKETADSATLIGFLLAFAFIGIALYLGGSVKSFFNLPSLFIVIGGTIAVTLTSFSGRDIASLPKIVGRALFKRDVQVKRLINDLLDIATISKKHGVLSLQKIEGGLKRDKFLHKAIQYVSDGYTSNDIQRILTGEISAVEKRHEQSAAILYRAAEIAPAMGLIGTLIGLVQMLATLDDPSSIGPSMAVALLTTFYGALMGTVFLSPLAAKLERNSEKETKQKTLIMMSALSMAKHENPRRLEMQLNSQVSPHEQVLYSKEIK